MRKEKKEEVDEEEVIEISRCNGVNVSRVE